MEQGFFHIGNTVERGVMWLTEHFSSVFDVIKDTGNNTIEGFENILLFCPFGCHCTLQRRKVDRSVDRIRITFYLRYGILD